MPHDDFATLDNKALDERAYAAWDAGELKEASRHFAELLRREPGSAGYHYMQGLAHKYLRDWPVSLHHNLQSQALRHEPDEASLWNTGIAATALGDWAEARRAWAACGMTLPGEEGPIEGDFGIACVRLNPWGEGETMFARRIDPVRARLLAVPLPESGYRCGDIVLNDGASTGRRRYGDGTVPVFNAMERLVTSEFRTFAAFVSCPAEADIDELLDATLPGVLHSEDWTSMRYYCLRCSYGVPHGHEEAAEDAWTPERNLGIAAQSRRSVEKLLADWQSMGSDRRVEGIESREHPLPAPEDGTVWWRGPDGDEDE